MEVIIGDSLEEGSWLENERWKHDFREIHARSNLFQQVSNQRFVLAADLLGLQARVHLGGSFGAYLSVDLERVLLR